LFYQKKRIFGNNHNYLNRFESGQSFAEMMSRWNSFFIFCFVIHALVFAFFPKKHTRERLPHALITQNLGVVLEAPQAGIPDQALLRLLLWQIVSLAEDFSKTDQPNFHLRLNRFYRYSASFIARYLAKLPRIQQIERTQKPGGEYAASLALLPKYYSFLFRLTPF
jgi:hypothetical protein